VRPNIITHQLCESNIETHFTSILKNGNITTVSFDVYDTLVRRTITPPSQIFFETAARINKSIANIRIDPETFRQIRINAERLARSNTTLEEINLDKIYEYIDIDANDAELYKLTEMTLEVEAAFADPLCRNLVQISQKLGKTLIAVSDMYLDKATIGLILEKCYPLVFASSEIYVSSDTQLTKSSGRQFHHILKQRSLATEQLFHVGDNLGSDVISANKIGIRSLHFYFDGYLTRVSSREESLAFNSDPSLKENRRQAIYSNPHQNDTVLSHSFNIGAIVFGPLLSGFAMFILQKCMSFGITQVVFITREGTIFKRIFDAYCLDSDHSNKINSVVVPSSRIASLPAALATCSNDRELLINSLIELQSGVQNNLLKVLSDFYGLDPSLKQIGVTQSTLATLSISQVEAIIESLKLAADIQTRIMKSTIDFSRPYVLVDLGANGTTTNQLAKVLPVAPTHVFLFYASTKAYEGVLGKRTIAFFPPNPRFHPRLNKIRNRAASFEPWLVGTEQSVIAYSLDSELVPVPLTRSDGFHTNDPTILNAFEMGVISYIEQTVSDHFNRDPHRIHDSNNLDYLLTILYRYVISPTSEEAMLISKLFHDENYLQTSDTQVIPAERYIDMNELTLTWRKISRGLLDTNTTQWPEAQITLADASFICDMLLIRDQEDPLNHFKIIEQIIRYLIHNNFLRIYVYGAGLLFENFFNRASIVGIRIESIVVTELRNDFPERLNGIRVLSLKDFNPSEFLPIVLCSTIHHVEIRALLKATGYPNSKIIDPDSVNVTF